MPQIDFGQAFATATEAPVPFIYPAQTDAWASGNTMPARAPAAKPLSRSSWANITYVTLTMSGGLFCAFYFFNAGDVLRAAAAWPRELLYSRPFASAPAAANGDRGALASGLDSDSGSTAGAAQKPFSRAAQPLQSLNQFPSAATASTSAPTSNVGGSFAPIPAAPGGVRGGLPTDSIPGLPSRSGAGAGFSGGPGLAGGFASGLPAAPGAGPVSWFDNLAIAPAVDGLMQTFNKGVADLQRATLRSAHSTVVVVKTAVPPSQRRAAAAAARKAAHLVQRSLGNTPGQTATQTARSTASSLVRTAASQANSVQNQASAAVRSTTGSVQSAVGGATGTVSGGVSGGAGTVNSTVQAGAGTVGGAVGGVTSSLGSGGGFGGSGLGSGISNGLGSNPIGGLGGGLGAGVGRSIGGGGGGIGGHR